MYEFQEAKCLDIRPGGVIVDSLPYRFGNFSFANCLTDIIGLVDSTKLQVSTVPQIRYQSGTVFSD